MRSLARILLLLLALGSLGLAPEPAAGQTRNEVRAQLEETDAALERALKTLGDQGCDRGIALVARAREIQSEARGAFQTDVREGLRLALARTATARRLLSEAVEICQVEVKADEQIRELFLAVQDAVDRARRSLGNRPGVEADQLLRAGVQQLDEAQAAYRGGDLRRAVRMLELARKLVDRALAALDAPVNAAEPAQVGVELERTDEILAELRARALDPRDEARRNQAEAHQSRARTAYREGRVVQAVEFTLAARRSAVELLRGVGGAGDEARIGRAIEIVASSLEELAPRIRESGDEAGLAWLEEAESALGRARAELAAGRLGPAARGARIAGTLLRRAAESSGVR